jgi:hypothetical protein
MFRLEDFEVYAPMVADPEVQRYLGDGKPASRSDSSRLPLIEALMPPG